MNLFLSMLLAHLLYDFHWQVNGLIDKLKGESVFIMLVHSLTWALVLAVPMTIFGKYSTSLVSFLCFSHFAIDMWKCENYQRFNNIYVPLYIDQFLHLITILIVILMVNV